MFIKTTFEDMVPEGLSSLLDLRVDRIKINALIPNYAMNRLNVRTGDPLYALIKKEHVNIVQSRYQQVAQ